MNIRNIYLKVTNNVQLLANLVRVIQFKLGDEVDILTHKYCNQIQFKTIKIFNKATVLKQDILEQMSKQIDTQKLVDYLSDCGIIEQTKKVLEEFQHWENSLEEIIFYLSTYIQSLQQYNAFEMSQRIIKKWLEQKEFFASIPVDIAENAQKLPQEHEGNQSNNSLNSIIKYSNDYLKSLNMKKRPSSSSQQKETPESAGSEKIRRNYSYVSEFEFHQQISLTPQERNQSEKHSKHGGKTEKESSNLKKFQTLLDFDISKNSKPQRNEEQALKQLNTQDIHQDLPEEIAGKPAQKNQHNSTKQFDQEKVINSVSSNSNSVFNRLSQRSPKFQQVSNISFQIKEENELKNCTFKPQINSNSKANRNNNNNHQPIFQRLYKDSKMNKIYSHTNNNSLEKLDNEHSNNQTHKSNMNQSFGNDFNTFQVHNHPYNSNSNQQSSNYKASTSNMHSNSKSNQKSNNQLDQKKTVQNLLQQPQEFYFRFVDSRNSQFGEGGFSSRYQQRSQVNEVQEVEISNNNKNNQFEKNFVQIENEIMQQHYNNFNYEQFTGEGDHQIDRNEKKVNYFKPDYYQINEKNYIISNRTQNNHSPIDQWDN